ncbi:MAG: hypothetical protein ACKV2O_05650 [Acidimicrobiales bacterium]
MSARFVVLGLARPRTPWFGEVSQWATSGAAPLEFIRCVSREEVAVNLASGRAYSALLVDGASIELDRDLVDAMRSAGTATIVVEDRTVTRDWQVLGVQAVLRPDFSRTDLVVTLDTHAAALEAAPTTLAEAFESRDQPAFGAGPPQMGRWISVTGAAAGASVLAMALAQALGSADQHARAGRRATRRPRLHTPPTDGAAVLLADLALDADQAMLHGAPDIVPGLNELVDAYRANHVPAEAVRNLTFAVHGRHYQLLLGLRRHRDWAALRPRALHASLDGLSCAFPMVVADVDADVEGETDCGSVEIEERNALARACLRRSDVVLVVGGADLKGLHSLIRTLGRLRHFGLDPARLVPVVNRAPRHPRARAEITRAITTLVDTVSPAWPTDETLLASPGAATNLAGVLFVPEIRRLDSIIRDGAPLPATLCDPLGAAVTVLLERMEPVGVALPDPVAVRPGELGGLFDLAAS